MPDHFTDENEGEPVAWQYRILAGAEWTSWLPLDKPEWFLTNYAFNIANGTAKRRPLYARPDPAVERLQRELDAGDFFMAQANRRWQAAEASLVKAREALKQIADQDDVELALDPSWAKRIATAALGDQP